MKLAAGFVQAHDNESIEALREQWHLQALPRGEYRHVGYSSLAGARTIPAQRIGDLCREVVTDDLGTMFPREADQHGSLTHRRVDIVDAHRTSLAERLHDQLYLSPLGMTVVTQPILADVHVSRRETLVVEAALA